MQTQARAALYGPLSRYFTETEEALVRSYADGLLDRLQLVPAIERAERTIVEDALSRLMSRYPQLVRDHGADTEQRGRRDMTFVYRYAMIAMLLEDPSFIRDKLATWMKSIVLALLPREPMVYGYQQLIEAIRAGLDERHARALIPYVEVVRDELARERSST